MTKPAPKFWWDFSLAGTIIVQSDWPGGEKLAEFVYGNSGEAIKQAEALIADFEAGRKTPEWKKR